MKLASLLHFHPVLTSLSLFLEMAFMPPGLNTEQKDHLGPHWRWTPHQTSLGSIMPIRTISRQISPCGLSLCDLTKLQYVYFLWHDLSVFKLFLRSPTGLHPISAFPWFVWVLLRAREVTFRLCQMSQRVSRVPFTGAHDTVGEKLAISLELPDSFQQSQDLEPIPASDLPLLWNGSLCPLIFGWW